MVTMMVGYTLLLSHSVFSSRKLEIEPPLLSPLLNWLKAISSPVNPLRRHSPQTGPVILLLSLITSPVNPLRRHSPQTGPVILHQLRYSPQTSSVNYYVSNPLLRSGSIVIIQKIHFYVQDHRLNPLLRSGSSLKIYLSTFWIHRLHQNSLIYVLEYRLQKSISQRSG